MVRPDGIPEDIWKASQFIMGWEHRLMPDNARHLTEEVARAILAERDRCVSVAENFRDPNPFPTVYAAIAASIRKGAQ
jgi:hypothetical protein